MGPVIVERACTLRVVAGPVRRRWPEPITVGRRRIGDQ
jgi:hypothetical protein